MQEAKRPIRNIYGSEEGAFQQHTGARTGAYKDAVISFHDRLVPVNLYAPTANVCFVFFHFLRDGAREFYAKVDLTQLWPFQSPAFVINF